MFKYITGSRLYGYSTEKSDTDYKVVLPNKQKATREFINGAKIDTVYWSEAELENEISLGNPFLVECLFVPEEFILTGKLKTQISLDIVACTTGYKKACLSDIEDVKFLINCESCQVTKIVRSFLTEAYRVYYDLLDLKSTGKITYPKKPEQIKLLKHIKTGELTGIDAKIMANELSMSI